MTPAGVVNAIAARAKAPTVMEERAEIIADITSKLERLARDELLAVRLLIGRLTLTAEIRSAFDKET